jgi:hypothetical protein
VLFVGGFMSEFYDELSRNLENEINAELKNSALALNVHIDLPFDKSIDIPIGNAIADALPHVDLPIEPGTFISFHTQMSYFDAQGIAYQNLSAASKAFDTSESVKHNAAAILGFLRSTDKKIVIVSHSKGGLDTLDALLDAPDLWGRKVLGWVARRCRRERPVGRGLEDRDPRRVHACPQGPHRKTHRAYPGHFGVLDL